MCLYTNTITSRESVFKYKYYCVQGKCFYIQIPLRPGKVYLNTNTITSRESVFIYKYHYVHARRFFVFVIDENSLSFQSIQQSKKIQKSIICNNFVSNLYHHIQRFIYEIVAVSRHGWRFNVTHLAKFSSKARGI